MKRKAFGHPTVLVPAPGLKAAWLPRLIATSTGTNPYLRRGHGYWLTILYRWVRPKHLRKAVRSSQGRSADLKCAMFVSPFDICAIEKCSLRPTHGARPAKRKRPVNLAR